MPTFIERLPASLYLTPALFIIFAWTISLSSSTVIQTKGLLYYLSFGLLGSWCAAYFIVLAVFSVRALLETKT